MFNNLIKILPIQYIYSDSKFSVSVYIYYTNLLLNLFVLNKHQNLRFKMLSTISCIDFPELENRFEIIYTLMSLDYPLILNIKTKISEFIYINSCSIYFKNAVWLEREIWDMFGVYFVNNFDLRRILTDYGFPYHPLRKTFPLQGYIQIYYNFVTKHISYSENQFSQVKSLKSLNSVWNKVI